MQQSTQQLLDFVYEHPRLLVITGAGLSTPSQIPDYRDNDGNWKRQPPVMYRDFMDSEAVRKRYWGRSLVGWQYFSRATPNPAHHALVQLERSGHIQLVVTQNVDDLHQRAGQRNLLALHGTIDKVKCTKCGETEPRAPFQNRLVNLNPLFAVMNGTAAPDGDADLEQIDFDAFRIPDCRACGDIVKPDAVFYGESVPQQRHRTAEENLEKSDGVLIVGSSLMVYSGYRLAKKANELKIPIAALNQGVTRADPLLTLKVSAPVEETLPALANALTR